MGTPLKITAFLSSPLAGDAPMLDAILEWYAFKTNFNDCSRLSKGMRLSKHDRLTYYMIELLPLDEFVFKGGKRCYCVSSPIIDAVSDGVEHYATRMDFSALKDRVSPSDVGKLAPATGPYHPSFEPFRVRAARAIVWYALGTKRYLKEWLSGIESIGSRTAAGFGAVSRWCVEDADEDFWLFSGPKKDVLMRPVPVEGFDIGFIQGARYDFGAIVPPYWHPQRQMEILRPC